MARASSLSSLSVSLGRLPLKRRLHLGYCSWWQRGVLYHNMASFGQLQTLIITSAVHRTWMYDCIPQLPNLKELRMDDADPQFNWNSHHMRPWHIVSKLESVHLHFHVKKLKVLTCPNHFAFDLEPISAVLSIKHIFVTSDCQKISKAMNTVLYPLFKKCFFG